MRSIPVLAPLMLCLAACSAPTTPAASGIAPPPSAGTGDAPRAAATRGLAFARQNCSRCHAVQPGQSSPNVEAPPFEAVVNQPGLSAATIKPWLHDSHNFPAMMDFAIPPGQIDDLAAYMLTLQRSDYVPAI